MTPRPKQRETRASSWHTTTLIRLISNPAYIGKRVHRGVVIGDAAWPAILDEATFHQCVAKLADPSRAKMREASVRYLLSGVATCGVCGGSIGTRRPRGYPSYVCSDRFCVARKLDAVDMLVTEAVIARLSRPDAVELLQGDGADSDVREALQERAGLLARLDSFYDAAASGEITAAALGRIEAKLLAQVEAVSVSAQRTNLPTVLIDLAGKLDVRARWGALELSQQRQTIAGLLDVRIQSTTSGRRPFDPASVTLAWRSV